MADEQKPKGRKKGAGPESEGSTPVTPAKTKGKAAGKAESAAPVAEPPAVKPQTKSVKIPKLQKKHKGRLPRRQKKALQKAADARAKA
jgi:hypothetical protein